MEADAGEDWRIDPILREQCQPVVNLACRDVRIPHLLLEQHFQIKLINLKT